MPTGALTAQSRQLQLNNQITSVAYGSLKPVRKALIRKMQQVSASQAGPEALRTGSRKRTLRKWG